MCLAALVRCLLLSWLPWLLLLQRHRLRRLVRLVVFLLRAAACGELPLADHAADVAGVQQALPRKDKRRDLVVICGAHRTATARHRGNLGEPEPGLLSCVRRCSRAQQTLHRNQD